MSPDLRLRLHATQAQPCFPAASNALALPGGNGIFTATPAERITHYTLLRKVVCQMGALPPLETPTRKGGTLPPSTGRIPPFLVIQPSGCIGWAKVSVGLMWYHYLSEPPLSHFEIVLSLILSLSANSRWVYFFAFLSDCKYSKNSFISLRLIYIFNLFSI